MRKVSDVAILVGIRGGLGPSKLAPRLGMALSSLEKRLARLRRRGLLRPPKPRPTIPDAQLLALRKAGLSASEIAARLGFSRHGVQHRLRKLRRRGVSVLGPPQGEPSRRVSDEALTVLARMGLPAERIAARVGLRRSGIQKRLASLRRRGLLPPASPSPVGRRRLSPPRVSDVEILELWRAGLNPHQIAARTGMKRSAVYGCLGKLRRQGASIPSLRASRVSDKELIALVQAGGRPRDIADQVRLKVGYVYERLARLRKQGLIRLPWLRPPRRFTDEQLLGLVREGDSPLDIARKLAVTREAVYARLKRLRERGRLAATPPSSAKRQFSDEKLIALFQAGLRRKEIAQRLDVGIRVVREGIRRLWERGLLATTRPRRPERRFNDEELIALGQAGLTRREIARRTGLPLRAVRKRLQELVRSGAAAFPPPRPRPRAARYGSDEQLLGLVQDGLGPPEIAPRLGASRRTAEDWLRRLRQRGLLPPSPPRQYPVTNEEILELRRAGRSNQEIAARTGINRRALTQRFYMLRRRGIPVPKPAGRRPSPPNRRVSDEQLVALVREGLGSPQIAARLGMRASHVRTRLAAIRRRGLLPPARPSVLPRPAREERDRQILVLHQEGLLPRQIAARLGIPADLVRSFLSRVRRRGLLPPALPRRGVLPAASPNS